MKRDYTEITGSNFKDIYTFSDKVDLFFTNVTVSGKKLMPISKPFMKRIKMCNNSHPKLRLPIITKAPKWENLCRLYLIITS
jgi:hypothetical protein